MDINKGDKGGYEMSGGLKLLVYLLSFLIPIIGFIMGTMWLGDHNPEKQKAGKNCFIIGGASIILSCIFWITIPNLLNLS